MRILVIVRDYLPQMNAGAERMLHHVLVVAKQRGHEVVVNATNATGEVDGLVVSQRLHPRERADIVVTQLGRYAEARRVALRLGVPLVHFAHHERQVQRADLLVCNTEHVAATTSQENVMVCHPPVDPEAYRVEPGGHVTMINLMQPKGSDLFYDLASRMPGTRFLGVRGGWGEQVVEDHANVRISPSFMDARNIYAQARILLMPGRPEAETYGRCALEALSSGIPVLAADDNPGLREALGDCGVYLPRDKPEKWVEQIAAAGPATAGAGRVDLIGRAERTYRQTTLEVEALLDRWEVMTGLTPVPAAERQQVRNITQGGVKPGLSVVIAAHPKRKRYAVKLAREIGDARIVYDPSPPHAYPGNALRVYREALAEGCNQGTSHILVVQDDAIPLVGIREAVLKAITRHPDKLIALYVGDLHPNRQEYTESVRAGERYCMIPVPAYVPTVALVWPAAAAAEFHAYSAPARRTADDSEIAHWRRKQKPPAAVVATIPSIFRHDNTIESFQRDPNHPLHRDALLPADLWPGDATEGW